MKKILSNKIKCKFCGDIIESKDVHDFKTCKCGKVSVDGGLNYLKRMIPSGMKYDDCIQELSVYIEDEETNDKCE